MRTLALNLENTSMAFGVAGCGIWERAYRNGMLLQAERYAAAIPSLEWMYFEQWPMEIIKKNLPRWPSP